MLFLDETLDGGQGLGDTLLDLRVSGGQRGHEGRRRPRRVQSSDPDALAARASVVGGLHYRDAVSETASADSPLLAEVTARGDEPVLWLGTVSPQGRPSIRPVWFVVHEGALVVFSAPEAWKVRHVQANPEVVVTFHTDAEASSVLVASGRAEVTLDGPPASSIPAYLAKYEASYPAVGYDREGIDTTFSARITITPTRAWGW